MKYDITLERIANCYYNLGLERARLRDLSGAAELLKKESGGIQLIRRAEKPADYFATLDFKGL